MKKRGILLIATIIVAFMGYAQELYVLNSQSQLEPLIQAVTAGTKIKGSALLSVYGGKMKTAIIIDGKSAELSLPLGATYFYIHAPKNFNVKTWKLAKVDSKKKNRELVYSKTGAFSGVESDIDEIELSVEKLSSTTYLVKPKDTLPKGEYAFFRMDMGIPSQIYDFRVDPSLSPMLQIPDKIDVLAELDGEGETEIEQKENNRNSLLQLY